MEWRELAACLTEDPDLFFPIGSSDGAYEQLAAAKQVCGRCGVRGQCLAWALNVGPINGVWGGTSEMERMALRRRKPTLGPQVRS
jgi:WhiB family redox-sensing transcriptional regulator